MWASTDLPVCKPRCGAPRTYMWGSANLHTGVREPTYGFLRGYVWVSSDTLYSLPFNLYPLTTFDVSTLYPFALTRTFLSLPRHVTHALTHTPARAFYAGLPVRHREPTRGVLRSHMWDWYSYCAHANLIPGTPHTRTLRGAEVAARVAGEPSAAERPYSRAAMSRKELMFSPPLRTWIPWRSPALSRAGCCPSPLAAFRKHRRCRGNPAPQLLCAPLDIAETFAPRRPPPGIVASPRAPLAPNPSLPLMRTRVS